MKKELSIYVHIPFCERKCLYCDFLSFYAKKERMAEYFKALSREVESAAKKYGSYQVKSVFFGGGTPSFPDASMVCGVLGLIKDKFEVTGECEISIEANPASAIYDKLLAYKRAGFNRLSIGAQSLNDGELKKLGRLHDSRMLYETFEDARLAGFDNINVDVMSALPDQSLQSYMRTLRRVVEMGPEHISAYSLIVEEGTPFYDMELHLPDEDTDRLMYHETKKYLADHGYHRYEISNYARDVVGGDSPAGAGNDKPSGCSKERYESVHNKVYWQRGNYLGLGLGASSMVENVRWSNIRDINEYIDMWINGRQQDTVCTDNSAPAGHHDALFTEAMLTAENREELSIQSQMEEFMFLGLRMVRGVSVSEFKRLFSKDIYEVYGDVIDKYVKSGHLELVEEKHQTGDSAENCGDGAPFESYLRLTDEGLDVSNTVMAEFLL